MIAFGYRDFTKTVFAAVIFSFGFFLGSAYQINTTAASDLGRQVKDKRATSTITGIIDACGNTGAGLGQVLLGATIQAYGWYAGYLLVLAFAFTASLVPLAPVFWREMVEIRQLRRANYAINASTSTV